MDEELTMGGLAASLGDLPRILLHPQTPKQPPWSLWPWVVMVAFALRVGVALSGDFIVHPDEIMQYLEPAHRLVFGNGVTYWEYFYGARQWFVPGLVAGILALLNSLGLGEPQWYISAVKIVFCGISLAIPVGMYFFMRWHFSEMSARTGLIAGAFWYELVGFAHKPMTEFLSTALVMVLLALCIGPKPSQNWTVWAVALIGVLGSAMRFQYAPMIGVVMAVFILRTRKKIQFLLISITSLLLIGIFDGLTWNRGPFHSYLTNFQYNISDEVHIGLENPSWQYLWLILIASAGFSMLVVGYAALMKGLRRYGFLLGLMIVLLAFHSISIHKEYRFIFAIIPLWLMISADFCAHIAVRVRLNQLEKQYLIPQRFGMIVFFTISFLGILNYLPSQNLLHRPYITHVNFIRNQISTFTAYRYLSQAPDVKGVWAADTEYSASPGYYYLHRKIPFYDARAINLIGSSGNLTSSVSHIVVVHGSDITIEGYTLDKQFGSVVILKRQNDQIPINTWTEYNPIITKLHVDTGEIVKSFDPNAPDAPGNFGIEIVESMSENTTDESL